MEIMRKIFWALLFFAGYVYVTTSGKEHILLEKGKALYSMISEWFEDAELDFHMQKPNRKSRRR